MIYHKPFNFNKKTLKNRDFRRYLGGDHFENKGNYSQMVREQHHKTLIIYTGKTKKKKKRFKRIKALLPYIFKLLTDITLKILLD